MKKTLSLCLMLSVLMLSGCMEIPTTYELAGDSANIVSIELYFSENVAINTDDIDAAEPIAVLSHEDFSEFSESLSELAFYDFIILLPIPTDPNFDYYGFFVRISYSDGMHEYISSGGVQDIIYPDGKNKCTHFSCDEEEWISFLKKFFDEELFDTSRYTSEEGSPQSTPAASGDANL